MGLQPGEGLAVRRGEQGHWLISSDDGRCLFEADPHHPQRQRLKMLGDRNSNCLNLYYDDPGPHCGNQRRTAASVHPSVLRTGGTSQQVTQVVGIFPETAPLLLRRYSYDEAGHLNSSPTTAPGHLLRELLDENHCMTLASRAAKGAVPVGLV